MSKHTPGPWVATQDTTSINADDWMIGITDGKPDQIAVCGKRDACLIAAAPLLLNVAKMLVACADQADECDVFIGVGLESPLMHAAREAIASAEGG